MSGLSAKLGHVRFRPVAPKSGCRHIGDECAGVSVLSGYNYCEFPVIATMSPRIFLCGPACWVNDNLVCEQK